MSNRNIVDVLDEMIKVVKTDQANLISTLNSIRSSASYSSPEMLAQRWGELSMTLQNHIPVPKEEWEFDILSIFSTVPKQTIKEHYGVQ